MKGYKNSSCFFQNAVFMQSTLPEAQHDFLELFYIKQKLLYYNQTMSKTGKYHKQNMCNQKEILVKFWDEKGSDYSNCYETFFWCAEGKAQRMRT